MTSCYSSASHSSSCVSNSLPTTVSGSGLSDVTTTTEEVCRLLSTVKIKTASGPDGISSHMLRNTFSAIAPSLMDMFNSSLSKDIVPAEWKLSNITPLFKGKGDPSCVANYKPISLLSLPSKILEWIIHNRLLDHLLLNNFLSNCQFGFCPGSSTQEALLCATNDWSHCLDRGTSVAAVSLDLSKAFDRVPPANSSLPLLTLVFLALSLRGSVATSPAALSEWLLMAVRLRCTQSLLECCKAPSLALSCSRSI